MPTPSRIGCTAHAGTIKLGTAAFLATRPLLECPGHTLAKAKLAVRPKGGQRIIGFLAPSCLATLA